MQIFAFVNPKSGSRAGHKVAAWLRENKITVFDLSTSLDAAPYLKEIAVASKIKKNNVLALIAAGDGTISSMVALFKKNKIDIPVVPFPVGTVNELSWNIGWGGYYKITNMEKYLRELGKAPMHTLDLWRADTITAAGKKLSYQFQDFLSIGMDARIVHTVVDFQRKHPKLCRFRFLTIFWYILFGIYEALFRRIDIGKQITLFEGTTPVPCGRVGIIHVLNIATSGGHTDYFGYDAFEKKPQAGFMKPAINDGILELSATTGIRSFLRSAAKIGYSKRLRQIRQLEIKINPAFPQSLQIDGEKIEEKVIHIAIHRAGTQKILLGPGKKRGC